MSLRHWCALPFSIALAACAPDPTTPDAGADATTGEEDAGPTCPTGSHVTPAGCDATLTWSPAADLATGRDHHGTVIVERGGLASLIVVGGWVGSGLTNEVLRSPIASDGSLGAWETSELPVAVSGHAIAVTENTIVIAGGRRGDVGFPIIDGVWSAQVAADGSLSGWAEGPALPEAVFHANAAAFESWVYVTGGFVGTDTTAMVARASVGVDGVGAWEPMTPLPETRSHHASLVHDGRLYVIGGMQGNPAGASTQLANVLFAPIASDGTLGAWTSAGELAIGLATHSAFVHAGQLYVLGGVEDNRRFVARIRRAPILADGTLGEWETLMTPLPTARGHLHQTPIHGAFVYSVGGRESEALTAMPYVFIGRFE